MATPPNPLKPPRPTPDRPESLWVPGARSFDPVNDAIVLALLVVMMWCFGSYAFSVRRALYPMGQSLLEFVFLCFVVGVVGIAKIRSVRGNDAVSMPYVIGLALAITVFVARFTLGVGGIAGASIGFGAFFANLAVFGVVWAGVNWICRDCTVDPQTEETASTSMFDLVPEDRRRPGRSVVVFSLLAAMVFGLGQLVLARANWGTYQAGYLAAGAYTASALLLLALTNLSGLRLYMAGRLLRTPSGMVGTWVGLSLLVVAIALGAAWLIPRAGGHAGESLFSRNSSSAARAAGSPYGASSGIGRTNDPRTLNPDEAGGRAPGQGAGEQGAASNTGRPGRSGRGDEGLAAGGGSAPGAGSGADSRPSSSQGDGSSRSGGQGAESRSTGAPEDGSGSSGGSAASAPLHDLGGWTELLAKVLLALLGLAALAFLAYSIARAIAARFGGRSYRWPRLAWPWGCGVRELLDPFADPRALDRLDPRQRVLFCYGAFMVLADRIGCPRGESLTPLEFARDLPGPLQCLRREARDLSDLYVRAEYARPADMADSDPRIREIWERMRATYTSFQERA